jgi:phage-related protein
MRERKSAQTEKEELNEYGDDQNQQDLEFRGNLFSAYDIEYTEPVLITEIDQLTEN